jgi:uncharacterized membrane protein YgcG
VKSLHYYKKRAGISLKKILRIIMAVFIMVNLTSCKGEKTNEEGQESKESQESFDINIATNILNTYMGYMYSGDIERAKDLYSEKISEKGIEPYPTDLKILSYKTDEVNEVGRSGVFKVKVVRGAADKVISVLDNYNIKIELNDKEYKLTEIGSNTEKEAFLEGEGIRLKDKNSVKNNLIVDMSGIPYYAFPKNDGSMINKAPVPRKSFGMMAFSYNGERIAVSTKDENSSYLGIIQIDETGASQGGAAAGGGGTGDGGGEGGGGGSSLIIKEPPVGKDITSLDIIKDGNIETMAFSLEEKVIMAQYKIKGKGTSLRVYDVESGELVDFKFEEKFPIDKVDVVFSSFDKDVLNFEVKEKEATGKDGSEMLGKWQLDLKEFEVKKL